MPLPPPPAPHDRPHLFTTQLPFGPGSTAMIFATAPHVTKGQERVSSLHIALEWGSVVSTGHETRMTPFAKQSNQKTKNTA
jgi:hypothetical protein